MEKENLHKNIDELISKFPNGKELYISSALFNRAIQTLARGVDVYEVLSQIILICEDTTAAHTEYIKREMPRSILIDGKMYDYKINKD